MILLSQTPRSYARKTSRGPSHLLLTSRRPGKTTAKTRNSCFASRPGCLAVYTQDRFAGYSAASRQEEGNESEEQGFLQKDSCMILSKSCICKRERERERERETPPVLKTRYPVQVVVRVQCVGLRGCSRIQVKSPPKRDRLLLLQRSL
jgi:hypothetical protein